MISPSKIFDSSFSFEEKALEIFEFQKSHNPIYKKFCEALGIMEVNSIQQIPLLPIQAFKDAEVVTAMGT
ncbi:MAG: hypothetical protein WD597_00750, partial [Balneolaceae bacterium]